MNQSIPLHPLLIAIKIERCPGFTFSYRQCFKPPFKPLKQSRLSDIDHPLNAFLKSFPKQILEFEGPDTEGNVRENRGHWYEVGIQRCAMWALIAAVDRSMTWELTQINPRSGVVDVSHNTRTGKGQETYMGHPKGVNYSEVALSLCYYGLRKNRPEMLPLAEKIDLQRKIKN